MHDTRKLASRIQKLRKSLKGLPQNPTVEEVHDLRTRTRRVESLLQALELDSSRNEKRLLAGLKKVRSRAGDVRDMDVLMGNVIGLGSSQESDCVIRLANHLGAQRHRDAIRLHRSVQKQGPDLRRGLKQSERKVERALDAFNAKPDLNQKNSSKEDAPLHAMAVALRLSRELAAVPRLGPNNLHAFRIEAKRLRYVLQLADTHGQESEFLDQLKRVQDVIGEWHDWVELHTIAADLLQHDRCKIITEINQVEKDKLQEALRTTEQMRKRFLGIAVSEGTGRSHRKSRAKVAGPVLVAAAEIAS